MRETQTGPEEYEVLEELSSFDDSLSERIRLIKSGVSVNGQSPNGVLTSALEPVDPASPEDALDAQRKFIKEYSWALSLAIYPYKEQESRETLRAAAVDGLFIAGETYNPEEEPNFLKHLGPKVGGYLEEVFGKPIETSLPTADEFEAFVRANQQVATAPDAEAAELPEVIEAELSDEPRTKQVRPKPDKTALTMVERLDLMSPNRRWKAYYAGEMTLSQANLWASRYPDEVPIRNGEFEWIALTLADLD
jgi:hypothetical protein